MCIRDRCSPWGLEEFDFFAFDIRKEEIGQTAGTQAEQLVVEPFLAQYFLDAVSYTHLASLAVKFLIGFRMRIAVRRQKLALYIIRLSPLNETIRRPI